MTRQEVAAVLSKLRGTSRLMASLLYGAGLRLSECASLRVKDVDFALAQLVVRSGVVSHVNPSRCVRAFS
jgi:integrase